MTTPSKVTLNDEQKMYVLAEGGGYSCFGYQNCFDAMLELSGRLRRMNDKAKSSPLLRKPEDHEFGKLALYQRYKEMLEYVALNSITLGTWFAYKTPKEVRAVIEHAIINRSKLRLFYGDTATGKCWNGENDVLGRIGRSCGTLKSPLLIEPGEDGGCAILTDCILRIAHNWNSGLARPCSLAATGGISL